MTASTTTPVSDATATTPISAAPVAPEAVGSSGPHRWVGGVASGVAGRTRIPVTVLRVGWVGAVAICSSTGKSTLAWVPVVCYLACWWTLAKRRRPVETSAAAPMTTPAQRPAAPAAAAPTHEPTTTPAAKPTATLPAAEATATVPTTPAVDDTPQLARLKDFVRYVWGTQPTPQPTYTADLCGVVLTGLQIPGRRDIGYYAPRLPFGKLYVYPNYLVFLSESHNKPGVVPSAGRLVSVLLDAWRVIGFWRPIPLARQVYRSVTTDELDRLRKPLGNPNSIVVRRSDITRVSVRRYQLTQYVVVETVDGEIMLTPNTYLGLVGSFAFGFLLLRSVRMNVMGLMGLPWQTALVRELNRPTAASSN